MIRFTAAFCAPIDRFFRFLGRCIGSVFRAIFNVSDRFGAALILQNVLIALSLMLRVQFIRFVWTLLVVRPLGWLLFWLTGATRSSLITWERWLDQAFQLPWPPPPRRGLAPPPPPAFRPSGRCEICLIVSVQLRARARFTRVRGWSFHALLFLFRLPFRQRTADGVLWLIDRLSWYRWRNTAVFLGTGSTHALSLASVCHSSCVLIGSRDVLLRGARTRPRLAPAGAIAPRAGLRHTRCVQPSLLRRLPLILLVRPCRRERLARRARVRRGHAHRCVLVRSGC